MTGFEPTLLHRLLPQALARPRATTAAGDRQEALTELLKLGSFDAQPMTSRNWRLSLRLSSVARRCVLELVDQIERNAHRLVGA